MVMSLSVPKMPFIASSPVPGVRFIAAARGALRRSNGRDRSISVIRAPEANQPTGARTPASKGIAERGFRRANS
jgi:hypothetical protein